MSTRALVDRLESRRLLSAATWVVNGDVDPANTDDEISIEVSDSEPGVLEAVVNGQVVSRQAAGTVKQIKVLAGNGDDDVAVDLGAYAGGIKVLVDGGAGNDTISGGAERDKFIGGPGNDSLDGGAGNDTLCGDGGSDEIDGGDGNDSLCGDAGNDTIAGGWGNDTIAGDSGNDDLQGGAGDDKESGSSGNDTLYGGDDADTLNGGSGTDQDYADGTDVIKGRRGDRIGVDDPTSYVRVETADALDEYFIDRAVQQWSYLLGNRIPQTVLDGGGEANYFAPGVLANAGSGAGASAVDVPVHSTTNDQVAGVDEADLVQTDGRYIYTLTGTKLVIVDVRDPAAPAVVSTTDVGNVSGMYLDGSRLTLVGDTVGRFPPNIFLRPIYWDGGFAGSKVTVMDVSDPAAPATVSSMAFDGQIVSSRMIEGRLYLVLSNDLLAAPEPEVVSTAADGSAVYETADAYRARLAADPTLLNIPTVTTTAADGSSSAAALVATPQFYVPDVESGSWLDQANIMTVTSVDTRTGAPAAGATASVVGFGETVYASASSLYVAGYDWLGQGTRLLKFDLGADGDVSFAANGAVPGRVLDSFSMGESGTAFHVATDDQEWFRPLAAEGVSSGGSTMIVPPPGGGGGDGLDTGNAVFDLTQVGGRLTVAGSVTNIAPGETIQSARFVGDQGYLVTFHQVDPLFSLDLSDPVAPRVAGRLTVPGYSSYLQPLSDTLLLGVGQNADAGTGATDWSGVQVSLFDVSDPANPVRVTAVQLNPEPADGWAYSDAEWDSHALTYIADKGIVALPVSGDLELLSVSDAGLSAVAVVRQGDEVRRTVRVGEDVFAVGAQFITERAFSDLGTDVAVVKIADPPVPVELPLGGDLEG